MPKGCIDEQGPLRGHDKPYDTSLLWASTLHGQARASSCKLGLTVLWVCSHWPQCLACKTPCTASAVQWKRSTTCSQPASQGLSSSSVQRASVHALCRHVQMVQAPEQRI